MAENWRVIATVDQVHSDRAPQQYILLSICGTKVCQARQEGDRFFPVMGPYGLDRTHQLAGEVLAGNPRARTGPETLNALALACATFFSLYAAAISEAAGAPGSGVTPPSPEETAPPAPVCTHDARAVPPTQESLFTCTPCGG